MLWPSSYSGAISVRHSFAVRRVVWIVRPNDADMIEDAGDNLTAGG